MAGLRNAVDGLVVCLVEVQGLSLCFGLGLRASGLRVPPFLVQFWLSDAGFCHRRRYHKAQEDLRA